MQFGQVIRIQFSTDARTHRGTIRIRYRRFNLSLTGYIHTDPEFIVQGGGLTGSERRGNPGLLCLEAPPSAVRRLKRRGPLDSGLTCRPNEYAAHLGWVGGHFWDRAFEQTGREFYRRHSQLRGRQPSL